MSVAPPLSWSLPDGRKARLRPIAPDDFDLLTDFLKGLSREAGYNRLFSARFPSREEIRRWTSIDPIREVAFIVTTTDALEAEKMLAVGRFVHDDDQPDAEFALLVGDDCKRQGIGRRLLTDLIHVARTRNLRTLFGATLSTNVGMLALGRRCGFSARREIGDSTLTKLSLRLR